LRLHLFGRAGAVAIREIHRRGFDVPGARGGRRDGANFVLADDTNRHTLALVPFPALLFLSRHLTERLSGGEPRPEEQDERKGPDAQNHFLLAGDSPSF
jgi:hypothetical protein